MKTVIRLFSVCIICLLFASCSTTLYTSNAVNTPLLKEKGEIKINVASNNVQFAGAVSDNVGVMANLFRRKYKDGNYKHGGSLGELGIGYFKPLESDNNLIFEAYGGLGMGRVYKEQEFTRTDNNETYIGKFDANAGKLFVQPSFGYASRYFDIALTPRFSMIKYTDFRSEDYPESQLREDYLYDNEITRSPYFFAEPALTVRGGYKFIKLQLQYGLTLNMSSRIHHDPSFGSLGLVIDIAKWYNN